MRHNPGASRSALRGVLVSAVIMRSGFIKLHRQSITPDDWKTPERTLAWIDFLTLANYEDGTVRATYTFMSARWRVERSTVQRWVDHWISEGQIQKVCVQHRVQQCVQQCVQSESTFFIVNYAKYQGSRVQESVQSGVQEAEQQSVTSNKIRVSKSVEGNKGKALVAKATEEDTRYAESLFDSIVDTNPADRTKHEKNPALKESRVKNWAEDVEKMRRLDGVTQKQLDFMLQWLFRSNGKNAMFWQKNVRSGATLREKWPQLVMACKEDHQRSQAIAQKGSLTMPENL